MVTGRTRTLGEITEEVEESSKSCFQEFLSWRTPKKDMSSVMVSGLKAFSSGTFSFVDHVLLIGNLTCVKLSTLFWTRCS